MLGSLNIRDIFLGIIDPFFHFLSISYIMTIALLHLQRTTILDIAFILDSIDIILWIVTTLAIISICAAEETEENLQIYGKQNVIWRLPSIVIRCALAGLLIYLQEDSDTEEQSPETRNSSDEKKRKFSETFVLQGISLLSGVISLFLINRQARWSSINPPKDHIVITLPPNPPHPPVQGILIGEQTELRPKFESEVPQHSVRTPYEYPQKGGYQKQTMESFQEDTSASGDCSFTKQTDGLANSSHKRHRTISKDSDYENS